MPFYSSKSRSKRTFGKRRGKKTTKLVKTIKRVAQRQIARTHETHKNCVYSSEVALSSVATTPTYEAGHMEVAQGDTYYNRDAHQVMGVGTSLRFILYNNSGGPQIVRFLALENLRGTADTDYTSGASLFETNTGNMNFSAASNISRLHLRINGEKYRVRKDMVIKLGGTNDSSRTSIHKVWIPSRQTYVFDGSNAILPQKNNLVFMWFASEAAADESTGQTVELHYTANWYFKNK